MNFNELYEENSLFNWKHFFEEANISKDYNIIVDNPDLSALQCLGMAVIIC